MKKNSTSSIRLSNDSFFSEQYQFRLFCAVFGSARMLLKAACERRGVHFSATLSEPSTGRFLHLRSGFALPSLWVRSGSTPKSGDKECSKRYEKELKKTYNVALILNTNYTNLTNYYSCSSKLVVVFRLFCAVLASVVGWTSILPQENHPASRNREILGKSIFLQDFWISAVGGEMHFTASRQALKRGYVSPRFAKSGNPREIYFSPRFLDFHRRRGDAFYSFEASSQKG